MWSAVLRWIKPDDAEMSAIGTKRTSKSRCRMSAFGGKADIANSPCYVRF
jgi:hypothetical protein